MKRLGEQVSVSFWYLADARQCASHVRYWHKADIELHCKCPLLGVKRTCRFALHMSAFDPKRTSPVRTQ